jgi:hypothetical protein
MGRHHDGSATVGQRLQERSDLDDSGGVETVGRLVQHEQFGVGQQRGCDSEALFHTERERRCPVVFATREADDVEHFVDASLGEASERSEAAQVVPRSERSDERGSFDQRADAVREPFRMLDRFAKNRTGAAACGDEAEQDSNGCGFARSVRPDESDDSPGGQLECEVVDGGEVTERPGEVVCGDGAHG